MGKKKRIKVNKEGNSLLLILNSAQYSSNLPRKLFKASHLNAIIEFAMECYGSKTCDFKL